jgi:hypothetical protein
MKHFIAGWLAFASCSLCSPFFLDGDAMAVGCLLRWVLSASRF